jgi:REP element-mobilizing transposase RayT
LVRPIDRCILVGMSRRERPNLPGSAFHLTARIQNREALLSAELRSGVIAIIRDQLHFCDVELLAYAIMPNHFHLVIRQGGAPLCRFMQPIMRRMALLVQRAFDREGHVFERRYRDRPCSDPFHLRNSIAYTHMNPMRAGLTTRPEEYPWTSHNAWVGHVNAADGKVDPVALDRALPLFATAETRSLTELREDYRTFLARREAADRSLDSEPVASVAEVSCPGPPGLPHGDANWVRHFSRPWPEVGGNGAGPLAPDAPKRPDLSDIARLVVVGSEPAIDPAIVRSRWGGPAYTSARRAIILWAASVGYKGVQIAAYLRISARAVSAVLSAERRRRHAEVQ